jgi:hypothetical protein
MSLFKALPHALPNARATFPFAALVLALGACTQAPVDTEASSSAAIGKEKSACGLAADRACPKSLEDLENLSYEDLSAVFEASKESNVAFQEQLAEALAKNAGAVPEDKKALTLAGTYDGRAICRSDKFPLPNQFPRSIRETLAGRALVHLVAWMPDPAINWIAESVWKGKVFDQNPTASGTLGTVVNRINGSLFAEASYLSNASFGSQDLDYQNAKTGLGISLIKPVENFSVFVIRHVYDAVRVVNADERLYLGMAYMVDEPGKFDPNTALPVCYFAMKPKAP